ncbi:MAG: heavy-metal-associated domain-containing protein [Acidobacteriota bacterium]|nr:heavy-metal-associated domain-containing protein [Acidobacteriota bacterium]
MKKVPGVESVEVSLKQGNAIVQLQPGNSLHLDDLVQKVRDNGFHPKEARVSVRGELLSTGGKLQLKVSGTNDVYELTPEPQVNVIELKKTLGKVVLIQGVVPAPKDKSGVRTMVLKSCKLSP